MDARRRKLLKATGLLLGLSPWGRMLALPANETAATGNFRYVYSNPRLRDLFLNFYTHVFHLYPEHAFHTAVYEATRTHTLDRDIYLSLQEHLPEITPFLADLRYALPALAKQKQVMTTQTLSLLDPTRTYEGYLEIGSTGRYLSELEEVLDIRGGRYLLHTQAPGYGLEDIIERGRLGKLGTHIDMGDYSTGFAQVIPARSLDLVTVYIGLHHCPLERRDDYFTALSGVLKPGGILILRDHNAHGEDQRRIAALAHDTFNAGTRQSWEVNANERRNFYPLHYIIQRLSLYGLRHEGRVLYQDGDPTLNGLMAFTKV